MNTQTHKIWFSAKLHLFLMQFWNLVGNVGKTKGQNQANNRIIIFFHFPPVVIGTAESFGSFCTNIYLNIIIFYLKNNILLLLFIKPHNL